jgi:hypothetical protein
MTQRESFGRDVLMKKGLTRWAELGEDVLMKKYGQKVERQNGQKRADGQYLG